KPTERTDDLEFLRRVTLDIAGRIALPDEIRAFDLDRRTDKRLRAIDRLLASDECATYWAELRADELLPSSLPKSLAETFVAWLRDDFRRDASYRAQVIKLLTATGRPEDNPAVVFTLANLGPERPKNRWEDEGRFDTNRLTEQTSRVFLGIDLHCIQC